ncbi:peptidoglycan-binding domain-containing protein [Devosia sp.]|uniref:peptidoglycan-binding domain-containing protein n=1 Tax=Devosia sp. TaxID=1871048 RepID=UPI003264F9D8
MTAISFSQLPLAAGGALASSAGRLSLWSLARFMRAPLANSALIAMVTLTAMASTNALYFQTGRHPAPMFGQPPDVPVAITQQVVTPAIRKQQAPARVAPLMQSTETTGSVTPAPVAVPSGPVGNSDVYEVQKKLAELNLFQGTVDGYYGPNTAKAIRAFEERNGYKPMGAITPGIVDAVMRADAQGMVPVAQQQVVAPQPIVQKVVAPPPVPVQSPADRVVARLPVIEPQDQIGEALSTVAESAAGTIDSIVASVDGGRTLPEAPAIKPKPLAALLPVDNQPMPKVIQPVAVAPVVAVPAQQAAVAPAGADVNLTAKVQRGLSSLGFLQGPIDGHAGESTAKAIRNFEVYYNYDVTGQVSPQLVDMLVAAGASV